MTIRGEPFTILQAANRSLTHTSQHVGQIVFLAKLVAGPLEDPEHSPRAIRLVQPGSPAVPPQGVARDPTPRRVAERRQGAGPDLTTSPGCAILSARRREVP